MSSNKEVRSENHLTILKLRDTNNFAFTTVNGTSDQKHVPIGHLVIHAQDYLFGLGPCWQKGLHVRTAELR